MGSQRVRQDWAIELKSGNGGMLVPPCDKSLNCSLNIWEQESGTQGQTHQTELSRSLDGKRELLRYGYTDGLFLAISYKGNYIICDLLHVQVFTWHNFFKVPLSCSVYQYFIPFYCQITYHVLFIHSQIDGYLGYFHFWLLLTMISIHILIFKRLIQL